jgi:hypothetical protein
LCLNEHLQNAMRAKRLMLGNIRFIGELFKVDMLKVRFVICTLWYHELMKSYPNILCVNWS